MSVIERCWYIDSGEHEEWINREEEAERARGYGWTVVEYVPADQLRGAVAALREAGDAILANYDPQDGPRYLEIADRLNRLAAELGGQ